MSGREYEPLPVDKQIRKLRDIQNFEIYWCKKPLNANRVREGLPEITQEELAVEIQKATKRNDNRKPG